LDETTEALSPEDPRKIRNAVYSTFVREGIYKVPEKINYTPPLHSLYLYRNRECNLNVVYLFFQFK
jgi:hypothetical protein